MAIAQAILDCPSLTAELFVVPALTSVSNTDINIDATGTMLLPALASATSSRITVLGNRTMPALINAVNSTFTLAGSSLTVPLLSNIDGASIYVSNGTIFSLPSVTSYTLGTVSGLFAVAAGYRRWQ